MNRITDLTHSLHCMVPYWDTSCGFEIKTISETDESSSFKLQEMSSPLGIGTHIDSPAHMIAGGRSVTDFDLDELNFNGHILNFSQRCSENLLITARDIKSMMKDRNLNVKKGDFLLFYTGWDRFWEDKYRYINNHRFPSLSEDAASFMTDLGIAGIGTDTLSPDCGDTDFPVHRILLGAGSLIVENVANLSILPESSFRLMAAPMKIADAAEAPIRLFAFL